MTTKKRKPVKSRPWRKTVDPQCCIGCGHPFKSKDNIHDVGCMAIHDNLQCFRKYVADCKELGITP